VTEELRPEIIMAGRTDRGDWQDIAPHVSLPDEWFLRVQWTASIAWYCLCCTNVTE